MNEKSMLSEDRLTRAPRALTDKFRRVPIAELLEPKGGLVRVMIDYWWHVTANDEVLFYQVRSSRTSYDSPQCNRDQSVVKGLAIEGCTPRQIPRLFVPHRCDP